MTTTDHVAELAIVAGRLPIEAPLNRPGSDEVIVTTPRGILVADDRSGLLVSAVPGAPARTSDWDGVLGMARRLAAADRFSQPVTDADMRKLLKDGAHPMMLDALVHHGDFQHDPCTSASTVSWDAYGATLRVSESAHGQPLVALDIARALHVYHKIDGWRTGVVAALVDAGARLAAAGDDGAGALAEAAGAVARTDAEPICRAVAHVLLGRGAWEELGPGPRRLGGVAARLAAVAELRLLDERGTSTPCGAAADPPQEPAAELGGTRVYVRAEDIVAITTAGKVARVLRGVASRGGLLWSTDWVPAAGIAAFLAAP
jgi:hypothetical protein